MESMIEAFNKRVSVRSYSDEPISKVHRQKIVDLLKLSNKGPFGHQVRFTLVDFSEIDKGDVKGLGTYGFISGASSYIVSAIKKYGGEFDGGKAFVDVGYCFEKIILIATNLGLGTCWLGGTFKQANFAKSINALGDEMVPAISPIGYCRNKRTIRESVIRRFANSKHRKRWENLFFWGDFYTPLSKELIGDYKIPLECVRLGDPQPQTGSHGGLSIRDNQRHFIFF